VTARFSKRQIAAMKLDYRLFARHVVGFNPDPWQSDLLLNPLRPTIICSSRQVGKTAATSILAASHAALVEGTQTLIVSTGHSHAGYVLARVKEALRAAEEAGLCRITADSASRVLLENGSVVFVVASNPKASRGYSVSGLLIVDEAAHLPDEDANGAGVIDSVLPTLSAAGGIPILLSTPNGRQNRFARIWHDDDRYWHRIRVAWQDCPRLHGPIVESIRRSLPNAIFQQEYECSFIAGGQQLFDWHALMAAREEAEPLGHEETPTAIVTPLFNPTKLKRG
jgi:hypothetical protein